MLTIRNPLPNELSAREKLLLNSLRSEPQNFSIESEYPLVLGKDRLANSFCLFKNNMLVGHANYLERRMLKKGVFLKKIALIGNVATRQDYRGQGIMKALLTHLDKLAQNNQVSGIFLWSDLEGVYEKLGYERIGNELRFFANKQKTPLPKKEYSVSTLDPESLLEDSLNMIFNLREKMKFTIDRPTKDILQLIRIPETYLVVSKIEDIYMSYAIIGKGADFGGVIHEWGAKNFDSLCSILQFIFETTHMEDLVVLSPLKTKYRSEIKKISTKVEKAPMAYCKILDKNSSIDLNKLFIWGLDSI